MNNKVDTPADSEQTWIEGVINSLNTQKVDLEDILRKIISINEKLTGKCISPGAGVAGKANETVAITGIKEKIDQSINEQCNLSNDVLIQLNMLSNFI